MFFDSLSQGIGSALNAIKGKVIVNEKDFLLLTETIFSALMDSDVNIDVAKDFISRVKEQAIGKKLTKKFSPSNAIMNIVKEEIHSILGKEFEGINCKNKPYTVVMMVGLQGSGKTTTSAKLALYMTKKLKKKVLLASLDIYRPAAQTQLEILGTQNSLDTLEIVENQTPQAITKRALASAKDNGYDIVILDTAGRLHIDKKLMQELEDVKKIAQPEEILLVIDSMTGQDSINIIKNFNELLDITGVVMTRMDGDSKGGVALSVRTLTNCPIKFFGSGEKVTDFEEFYPERIAGRIMGMGDIASLMDKASQEVGEEEIGSMKQKIKKGDFDLNDLYSQFKTLNSLGGINKILNFIPGMGNMANLTGAKAKIPSNDVFKKNMAIINSMTKYERKNAQILNASRKIRIAKGSGSKVNDVNILLKQFTQAKTLFSRIGKSGMSGLKNMDPNSLMGMFGKK